MASRRRETSMPKERPVRFYKIVALTFLFITILLLGSILFMSSKRATVTVISKENPVDVTTAVEVDPQDTSSDNNVVNGVVTTTQVSVSSTFSPSGEKEISSTSTGQITIHNESNSDQPLVATTRFLSEDGVLFRLENRVLVPANDTITAEVYADQKGAQGDIEPTRFTIPGLSESRQRLVYGTSDKPMTGGVETIGVLSEEDVKQGKEKLIEQVKSAAENKFSDLENPDMGNVINISESGSSADTEVGTEVSEYTLTLNAEVVSVFYNKAEVNRLAKKALMKRVVDDTETIESNDKVEVSFDSHNPQDNTAIVNVFTNGTATLNPDSKQLDKVMFFGKTEEELRRYLLSLDHVHSVEVEFSPAWINSVPHVSDHVNIVVKKVD